MHFSIPNIITYIRFLISPLFLFSILSINNNIVQLGCILFLLGAITDFLDGWLARKNQNVTKLGIFLDPLADKFLTSAAFIAFSILGYLEWWMVLIIIIRDFSTTFLRIFTYKINKLISTSYSAKIKTFIQMTFISFILANLFIQKSSYNINLSKTSTTILNYNFLYYPMLFLTILTFWTAIEYVIQNKNLFKEILKNS